MKSKEEQYAQQLYQHLESTFKQNFISKFLGLNKPPVIAIEGSGREWKCLLSKGNRQCEISCIDIDRVDTKYKGPEYFTRFKLTGKIVTEGRTFHERKMIEAIEQWFKNKTVEELYKRFHFIDEEKRSLEKIRLYILEENPREQEVPQGDVVTDYFNATSLWLINKKRSCRVYFHGYDPVPRYLFYWNDQLVFERSGTNKKKNAALIGRYVFDKEIPAVLKEEFSGVDFEKFAGYYDQENKTIL